MKCKNGTWVHGCNAATNVMILVIINIIICISMFILNNLKDLNFGHVRKFVTLSIIF